MHCDPGRLQQLPALPVILEQLKCGGCFKIAELPQLPPSLTHLNINQCTRLQRLKQLPKASFTYVQWHQQRKHMQKHAQGKSSRMPGPAVSACVHWIWIPACMLMSACLLAAWLVVLLQPFVIPVVQFCIAQPPQAGYHRWNGLANHSCDQRGCIPGTTVCTCQQQAQR